MGEKAFFMQMLHNIGSWEWYPLDFGVLKAEIVKVVKWPNSKKVLLKYDGKALEFYLMNLHTKIIQA